MKPEGLHSLVIIFIWELLISFYSHVNEICHLQNEFLYSVSQLLLVLFISG